MSLRASVSWERSEIVRGDRTTLQVLFAVLQGPTAATRDLLGQGDTARDTEPCFFLAMVRAPARLAFPDVTLVESSGSKHVKSALMDHESGSASRVQQPI
jgi:hypothetical protein